MAKLDHQFCPLFQVSHLPACLRWIATTQRPPTLIWPTAWSARSPSNTTPPCSRSTLTLERSPPQQKVITHTCLCRHEPRHWRAELGALTVGESVICPSLPVIWQYSAAVKPDYTAHFMCNRLTLTEGRLPKCVAWCWPQITLSVYEHVDESVWRSLHLWEKVFSRFLRHRSLRKHFRHVWNRTN